MKFGFLPHLSLFPLHVVYLTDTQFLLSHILLSLPLIPTLSSTADGKDPEAHRHPQPPGFLWSVQFCHTGKKRIFSLKMFRLVYSQMTFSVSMVHSQVFIILYLYSVKSSCMCSSNWVWLVWVRPSDCVLLSNIYSNLISLLLRWLLNPFLLLQQQCF